MNIIYVIVFILISIIIWILNTPVQYSNIKLDTIDKFFFILKYRGIAEESIAQNTTLSIIEPNQGIGVGLIKYKEKGEIGIYFLVTVSNLLEKEICFIEKIRKYEVDFFSIESGVFNEKHYFVDIKMNFSLVKELLTFIWQEIYEVDLIFELYLQNNISNPSSKVVNFKKLRNQKSVNDINIPLTKWQWVLYKLRGGKSVSKG